MTPNADAQAAAAEIFFFADDRLRAEKIIARYFARLQAQNRFLLESIRAEQTSSQALFAAIVALETSNNP